jgi:hypothetical protein
LRNRCLRWTAPRCFPFKKRCGRDGRRSWQLAKVELVTLGRFLPFRASPAGGPSLSPNQIALAVEDRARRRKKQWPGEASKHGPRSCCVWFVVRLSVSVQWENDVNQQVPGFSAGLAGTLYLNCKMRIPIPKQERFMDDISSGISRSHVALHLLPEVQLGCLIGSPSKLINSSVCLATRAQINARPERKCYKIGLAHEV